MAGYTAAFDSMFQGSLCGQWPALPVFCTLLPLADKNGELDYSFGYLARVTGWPEDLLREGIAQLEAEDPHSRTPGEDGRRLVKLREHTEWGWRLVNHGKYREKARLMAQNAEQVADGRNAEKVRRYKERQKALDTAGHPPTPADTLSDSDTDTKKNTEEGRKRPVRRAPSDFEPDRAYALAQIPDLDVDREIQKFRDWEFKTPRKDWPACWRTWIGNARDRGQYAKKATKPDPYRGAL